jgi:ribonuclease HII
MFIVGVDENGLGPRLGPLIATAAVFEVDGYRRAEHSALGQSLGVYDSKATSGFGKMAAVEGIALALFERLHGRLPRDADQLLDSVCWEDTGTLRARCPTGSQAQCWSAPVELPAFGGRVDLGRQVLERLWQANIRIRSVRSAVVCSNLLNAEVSRLGSKLLVDLSLFERLMLEARSILPQDIEAFCGKVGGIDKYTVYFRHLTGYAIEEQARARSCYRVAGLGRVAFEIDADARHLPVGLASMVGKYLRELLMERQNRFYLACDPGLQRVSGYRDRLTADFVARTRLLRRKLGIADQCFERA